MYLNLTLSVRFGTCARFGTFFPWNPQVTFTGNLQKKNIDLSFVFDNLKVTVYWSLNNVYSPFTLNYAIEKAK